MTKVDIISGFLGAGKTTLIKKLIQDVFAGKKVVLIENEFGEIGIDGGFLKDAGINITEMNSGCICCSLVGDFGVALKKVTEEFNPDHIIIEPSGVGKLSDVRLAVENAAEEASLELNGLVTVADATKVKMYMKNFGEFYNNQVEFAGTIVLSRTQKMTEDKLLSVVEMLKEKNPKATIITTPWDQIDGKQIMSAIENTRSLADELMEAAREEILREHEEHEHEHHHEHDHDHEHHHDHDHEEHEHHHDHDHEEHEHHHDHDHEEHEHHEHHYDENGVCSCGHHHHHHHDADEIFTSWGVETPKKFTKEEIEKVLSALDSGNYGQILRAKGIVPAENGIWLHFDYVPEEQEVREGAADYTGRLCVIGAELKEDALKELFGL